MSPCLAHFGSNERIYGSTPRWRIDPWVSTDVEVEVFVVVSGSGRIVLLDEPPSPILNSKRERSCTWR